MTAAVPQKSGGGIYLTVMPIFNVEHAVQMYYAGKSRPQIAKSFNVTEGAVRHQFHLRGVVMRSPAERHTLVKPAEVAAFVSKYEKGVGLRELKAEFGYARNTIDRALRKSGVVIRSRHLERRQYKHNETAFDKITPEAAYWIGMLMADGHVTTPHPKKKSQTVSLGLCVKDEAHVEAFRAFVGSTRPLNNCLSE